MINVTLPALPNLEEVIKDLQQIWDTRILSNSGPFHQRFEMALSEYLQVPHIVLFNNATTALMCAQSVFPRQGEVITTPFTFAATAEAIIWAGNTPVFADIDPRTNNLCPKRVVEKITSETVAIMPVHCYGEPCDVKQFEEISTQYNLPIIYDACHAFGVQDAGGSILRYGDVSVVSLHATKVMNTFEGAVAVCSNRTIKDKLDRLRNFGFVSEIEVDECGLNGKMTEFSAVVGYHQLACIEHHIEKRKAVDSLYRKLLADTSGVTVQPFSEALRHNGCYMPLLFRDEETRDQVKARLLDIDVNARRYFYPLVPDYRAFAGLSDTAPRDFKNATSVSKRVLCVPIYPDLCKDTVIKICSNIRSTLAAANR